MAKSPSNAAPASPRRKATVSGGAPKDAVAPQWAQGGDTLTTATGVPVDDTDNSLRVGERGPTLLDDFHLREKIMHFDHERIPERVVHARGAGAHGTFRLTRSIENLTCASVLTDTLRRDPRLRPLLHGGRVTRLCRHRPGRPRFCRPLLHPGRELGSRREQHPRLLHSGRDQVPRPDPRGETRARP